VWDRGRVQDRGRVEDRGCLWDRRCLWDCGRRRNHDYALAFETERGDGFVGDDLAGYDYMCRALQREVAQAQVDAAAPQSLAAARERAEVVDGHDHRARTVQHRALDPRRMEDLGASWAVGLEDLVALARDVSQRLQ
jgi:hypothetical protein